MCRVVLHESAHYTQTTSSALPACLSIVCPSQPITPSHTLSLLGLSINSVSSPIVALPRYHRRILISGAESIKKAAKEVATDLLTFYHGDEPGWVPGILPGPPPDGDYYWWQGGAMWGALIDYRHYTGDKDYDDIITQAMLFQVGDDRDYNPRNWSASMGNDDQAFWAISAMIAAENGYTDPPKEDPQWLSLVQAVFNEQSSVDRRVSPQTGGACEGGLRWQVYPSNNGWDYVNSRSTATRPSCGW